MQVIISRNGQQIGAFEEALVLEMLRNGQLSPNDFGIRAGGHQWQPLGTMFTNPINVVHTNPAFQPVSMQNYPQQQQTQPQNSSSGILIALTAAGLLFVFGIIGIAAVLFLAKPSKPVSLTNTSNIPTPTPKPSYDFLQGKVTEFAKLTPPVKLQPKAALRGKTLIIEQNDKANQYSAEIKGFKYSAFDTVDETDLRLYGLTKENLPRTLDEIETIVQIICGKGREVGRFGPRTAYVPAYANTCKVAIINYKETAVVFQKTIENDKKPAKIYVRDNEVEHILPLPVEEIQKFVKSLPKIS